MSQALTASCRLLVSLLAFFSLAVVPASADEGKPVRSDELSAKDRVRYEKLLDKWRQDQKTLFERLRKSVQDDDTKAVYLILKEFHGGGAGVEGTEFELVAAEANETRRLLEETKRELKSIEDLEIMKTKYAAELGDDYQDLIKSKKQEIAGLRKEIVRMDMKAETLVKASVIKELAAVFELMSNKPSGDS